MNQNPLARTQYCNSLVIAHLVPDGWKLDRLENVHTAVLVVIEGDPPRVVDCHVVQGNRAEYFCVEREVGLRVVRFDLIVHLDGGLA